MKIHLPLGAFVLALLVSCGPSISESRMGFAPARPANCELQLIETDYTDIHFNQRWQILGTVTIANTGVLDPAAPENRAIVRPRACAMGGMAISIGMNAMSQNSFGGQGGMLVYMVLRPKVWEQAPQEF